MVRILLRALLRWLAQRIVHLQRTVRWLAAGPYRGNEIEVLRILRRGGLSVLPLLKRIVLTSWFSELLLHSICVHCDDGLLLGARAAMDLTRGVSLGFMILLQTTQAFGRLNKCFDDFLLI